MRVYMIRHGESEANKHNQWTGWLDVPLTDKGRKDATWAHSLLKDIKFDHMFSSDLMRARETARIALPDYEAEASPLLREINVGTLAGKEAEARALALVQQKLPEQGYRPFGGESIEEFHERLLSFMNTLPSLGGENVAVFAHAGCLRAMLDTAIGSHHLRKNVFCQNCTVAIFEYRNDTWCLHSWINPI